MNELKDYSFIWGKEKNRYVLVRDEFGDSIFHIKGKEIMFFIIEEEALAELIVRNMIAEGNKVFNNIKELKEYVRVN